MFINHPTIKDTYKYPDPMIKCIYCVSATMLVRICLFVCTWYVCGILLVSATPIHQGINKPAKTADNVQPLEKSTTEPTKSDDKAVESDITDDPLSDTDEKGTDNQSESENESDSGSDDETSTESDDEDYVPGPESNDSDDGSESESHDETDLKTSESAKDEGSEKRKIKNSVDNGSGKKSDSGEPSSDSEGDEVIETDDLKPENEVNLSTIQYNGVNLRVYKYQKNEEGLICHELKRQDKILDNRCFTLQP